MEEWIQPNWQHLAESAQPILEWMERQEALVGLQKAEEARRVLVKIYLASSSLPILVESIPLPQLDYFKEPPVIVKVEIPPNAVQAVITSQDRKTQFQVPVNIVARRLNGSSVGFFEATYEPGQVIELGERVPDQNW